MKLHNLLADEPQEEANLAPLTDFFFVVLMVVLLKATFFLVSVDPSLVGDGPPADDRERPIVLVRVLDSDQWVIDGSIHSGDQARQAIEAALAASDQNAFAVVSFSPDLTAAQSWEIRARLQHDWLVPFLEAQPLAIP